MSIVTPDEESASYMSADAYAFAVMADDARVDFLRYDAFDLKIAEYFRYFTLPRTPWIRSRMMTMLRPALWRFSFQGKFSDITATLASPGRPDAAATATLLPAWWNFVAEFTTSPAGPVVWAR